MKEIRDSNVAHSLVIHFHEEHEGEEQKILLRVLSLHRSAMERQVAESVWIEEEMGKGGECLNGKNEWAGSKIPKLQVLKPKGMSGGAGKEGGKGIKRTTKR